MFRFDDTSKILPNTNIELDYSLARPDSEKTTIEKQFEEKFTDEEIIKLRRL
tara:strand:- start:1798 stop:1953 length:156 start_codon:yes stop_codon:yes gene_type:complete